VQLGLIQSRPQRIEGRRVERVPLLGAVEREAEDSVSDGGEDRHGVLVVGSGLWVVGCETLATHPHHLLPTTYNLSGKSSRYWNFKPQQSRRIHLPLRVGLERDGPAAVEGTVQKEVERVQIGENVAIDAAHHAVEVPLNPGRGH